MTLGNNLGKRTNNANHQREGADMTVMMREGDVGKKEKKVKKEREKKEKKEKKEKSRTMLIIREGGLYDGDDEEEMAMFKKREKSF